MIRKLLTILSLIGLVLSVGLWGVSMKRHLSYIPHSLRFRLSVLGGATWVTWPDESYPLCTDEQLEILLEMGEIPGTIEDWSPAMINRMARPGISIYDWDGTQLYFPKIRRIDPQNETIIIIPFWIPTLIFTLALSATRPIHNFRRRKRKRLGLCMKCGYDLRGSQDRCPECGEEFVSEFVSERGAMIDERDNPCPSCGYSLLGLPSVYKCPECGFEYDPYAKVIALRRKRLDWTGE